MAEINWTKKGYKIIKNFFTKEELIILKEYCFHKLDNPPAAHVDGYQNHYDAHVAHDPRDKTTNNPSWYFDNLMHVFADLKKPLIEKESGIDLLHTYTYWRYYCFGGFLKKHLDRPSCQVSITANIYKYDNWPLIIGGSKIELDPGDAVLYSGCVVKHSRLGVYKGKGLAQVFLHYVDKNGPFTHHENDNYVLQTGNIASDNDQKNIDEMIDKFNKGENYYG